MDNVLLGHEPLIRLGFFAGVLALMAGWELLAPRRPQAVGRGLRWPNNFGIVVVDTLLLRLVFPTAAVSFALFAETQGWGLFNAVAIPWCLAVIASVLILDFSIYLQHVVFHAVPALWRLHRMHHADLEFDVTTGLRFHPIEILLSMGIKFGVVAALGAPAVAVLIFEVLLNATSMFNHGNVRMPAGLDCGAALDRGDARHAPRAPFRAAARDQQQFRLQFALVGSLARDLPRPAWCRARSHDARHRAVPRSRRPAARPAVDPAVPRPRLGLSDQSPRGVAMSRTPLLRWLLGYLRLRSNPFNPAENSLGSRNP
jgi:hypothetical protein